MWPFTVLERCKFKCAISTVSFAPLAATAFLPAADWRNGFLLLCRFTGCGLQLCQSGSTNHGTAHYLTLLLSLEKVADHTDSLPHLWLVYTVVLADDSRKWPSTWPIFVPATFACLKCFIWDVLGFSGVLYFSFQTSYSKAFFSHSGIFVLDRQILFLKSLLFIFWGVI